MSRQKLLRWFSAEGLRELALEGVRAWLWPPLAAGVFTVISALENQPLSYIFLGAAFAFAVVATGLLRFDEWRFRKQAEHKLRFGSVLLQKELSANGTAAVSVGLGFQLNSSAQSPLEWEVKSIETEINGNFPPRKQFKSTKFETPAEGSGWFRDWNVQLPTAVTNSSVTGKMKFTVLYGHPGRRLYSISKEFEVIITFNPSGDVDHWEWAEI